MYLCFCIVLYYWLIEVQLKSHGMIQPMRGIPFKTWSRHLHALNAKLMGAFCTSYWILQMNSHALFPNLKGPLAALNTIERGGKLDLILTKIQLNIKYKRRRVFTLFKQCHAGHHGLRVGDWWLLTCAAWLFLVEGIISFWRSYFVIMSPNALL